MWVWDLDECMFNMFSASSFLANCGYNNFTTYASVVYNMLQKPWSGAYTGFTRLFVDFGLSTLLANEASIRQGLRVAHNNGVAIELLVSGSAWVKTTAGVNTAISTCQQVAWFNGNATDPRDVLDGVHYDIEPNTLGSGWTSNSAGGTDKYNNLWESNLIALFRGCMAVFAGTPTTVAWDVSDDYSYYVTDLWTPLVQDPYVSYVCIMDYHNTLAEMVNGTGGIGGVSNVLRSLNGAVPALFGAETSGPSLAPVDTSFWQNGTVVLEATLATLDTMYRTTPGYLGTAIHYSETFGVLPPNGFGTSGNVITACNTNAAILFGVANDTIYVSMKVYRATTNTFLKAFDVTNYIPGPWQMSIAQAGAGPYRIELYDGAGGTQLTPSSPIGMAVCGVMA